MLSQFRKLLSPSGTYRPFVCSYLNYARPGNVLLSRNFGFAPDVVDDSEMDDVIQDHPDEGGASSEEEHSLGTKEFFRRGPQKQLKKKVPQGEESDSSLANTVQLTSDTEMMKNSDKSTSPENDPNDDSVQWEKFDRTEVYKILRHMEEQKTVGIPKFSDNWIQPGTPKMSPLDKNYARHVQDTPKIIMNRAENNQWGVRMAANRNVRLNPPLEFDKWIDKLPADIKKRYAKQIVTDKEWYAKVKAEHTEKSLAVTPPEPASMDPSRYDKIILNPSTKEWKELYAGAEHKYTYEDWESELRRSLLHNHVAGPIPEDAQVALDKFHQLKKIDASQNVSPLLDKPSHSPAVTARYHDRMLRLYGAKYEPTEQFSMGHMLEQANIQTALNDAIATAELRPLFGVDMEVAVDSASTTDADGENKSDKGDKTKAEEDFDWLDPDGYKTEMTANEARTEMDAHHAELKEKLNVKKKPKKDKNTIPIDERTEKKLKGYNYEKLVKDIAYDQSKLMNPYDPMAFVEYLKKRANEGFQIDVDGKRFSPAETREDRVGDIREYFLFNTDEPLIDKVDTEAIDPLATPNDLHMKEFYEKMDPRLKQLLDLPEKEDAPSEKDIQDKVKETIYKLNYMDPVKYHSHRLAAMFALSVTRVQAILRLKFLKYDIMKQPNFHEENAELIRQNRDQAAEWDTEGWPLSKWDPEQYPVDANPVSHIVDEQDYQLYKRIENSRQARFWSVKDFKIRKEQARSKLAGPEGRPYGAPPMPLPEPRNISDQKQIPLRYNLVLTDIGGMKKNKFRIAVRDRTGHLREPNDEEFKRVRFREKSKKGFFNHIPYKVGESI